MNLFKKCIVEVVGAFCIVFFGCGAAAANQITNGAVTHLGVATAFAMVVMAVIYAGGHISGAHYNPAVTIAFSATRHFPIKNAIPYIISQFIGATLASVVHVVTLGPILIQLTGNPDAVLNLGVTQPINDLGMTAFIWEFILTGVLMFIVMSVATDCCAVGELAGLAVGVTIWFMAITGGPICGASMNPARSFGPALLSGQWQHYWAYVAGPILGAVSGGFLYQLIRCCNNGKQPEDKK